jgi:hypothetical protein
MVAFGFNMIYANLNRIFAITEIIILSIFFIYPALLVAQKNKTKAIVFILTQMFVFIFFIKILNMYKIDANKIDFKINENSYRSLIKSATPFKTWGDKRLFLINIDSRYIGCTRYLVYDESNEFTNPRNEFFGIGYTYSTRENGEKFHSGYIDVNVRKYGDYIYIADACHNVQ